MFKNPAIAIFISVFILLNFSVVFCQTTTFTYQGKLNDNGFSANANYDFQFKLFESQLGGNQVGSTLNIPNVAVSNGIFTVRLDFGANFDGTARFLEIAVKQTGSPNPFTILTPRQTVSSAPYSIQALTAANAVNAVTAGNSERLGGVLANDFVQTADSRLSDARPPLPGSNDYIQNTTNQQNGANFNVGGNGTIGGNFSANSVDSVNGYKFNGTRFFFKNINSNLFAGFNAGNTISTGTNNSFFGDDAGVNNDEGAFNSFFGNGAGQNNQVGAFNAFFGYQAGQSNTIANKNAFFGSQAGKNNTVGNNSFFGYQAGVSTNTGSGNSFFGQEAGKNNTTGRFNVFIGATTGNNNISGSNNTLIGQGANFNSGFDNLDFATAVGSGSVVGTSNTVVLGRVLDTVRVPGDLNITGNLSANGSGLTNLNAGNITNGTLSSANGGTGLSSAGAVGNFLRSNGSAWTSSPIQSSDIPDLSANFINNSTNLQSANFNISGNGSIGGTFSANSVNSTNDFRINNSRVLSIAGSGNVFAGAATGSSNNGIDNSFFGNGAGFSNDSGNSNSFFGRNSGLLNFSGGQNSFFGHNAGWLNSSGANNTFLGYSAGISNTTESNNTFIGANSNGSGGISFATAIGAGAIVTGSNTVSLGRNLDQVKVPGSLNVSGDSILNGKLGIGTNLPETVFHIRGQNNNNFKVGEANCFNGLYKFLGISFGSPIVNCTGYSFGGTSDGNTFINADGNLGTYFYYRGGNPFVVGQYVHAFVPVRLSFLSSQGMDQLCLNIDHEIANCSSSLRYKKDLTPFTSGLSVINRLQPITFRWKGNDRLDLGFGAEDIATIEPLLVTYNADGQVEGVKYDRLSTIFVNAFKEQQTQIEQQQKLIQEQQTQINALLKLVCAANKDAEICKEK